jgi:Zn-dependent protease with chaperone function
MTRYSNTTALLAIGTDLAGIFWLWLVLQSGLSGRMSAWSQRLGRKLFISGALFWIAYHAASWLVFLPLSIYSDYRLPHQYGLSTQSLGAWFRDDIVSWLIDASIGAVAAGSLLWLIRRSPGAWPYWSAGLLVPVIAFGIFATPLVVDPLYNKFTPLAMNDPLRPGIERLASRAGIPNAQIFVVDKSRQTNETNAYVTGLGASARIVIWDTLIRKTTPAELDAVLAHEMGHYVEHHVVVGFWLTSASLFLILPLVRWISLALLRGVGRRWGAPSLHDPAALPVILLVVSLIAIATDPITQGVSRYIEHRADAFGLALNGDRAGMAEAFIELSRDNLATPYPPAWIRVLDSHPPLGERVRFALYGKPSQLWPVPPQIPHSPDD